MTASHTQFSAMNNVVARGAKCDQVFLNPKNTMSDVHQNLTYILQAFSMDIRSQLSTLLPVVLLFELAVLPCT